MKIKVVQGGPENSHLTVTKPDGSQVVKNLHTKEVTKVEAPAKEEAAAPAPEPEPSKPRRRR